jgi:uncharacterized protein YecT (DUF1311 family)
VPPFSAAQPAAPAVTRVSAPPAARSPVLAPAQAARAAAEAVTRSDAAPPAAPQRPVVTRAEVAPVVPPRITPPPPKPIVVARREEARAPAEAPTVRETPSFSCNGARGAGAQVVCSDPRLARLDRIMAAEFAAAVAAGHDRERLEMDQDSWLARREAAAPDPDAVADVYRRRINQLRSMW